MAFASRLRESTRASYILSFLASDLETGNNCARVWVAIQCNLLRVDITTSRLIQHWKTLCLLLCEDRDSFLRFYSKAKLILHKLKKEKYVVVTDNNF